MTLKISISGVRGLVPETLTSEVCLDFAKAFGAYLSGEKKASSPVKVVVGTDPRPSSEFIKGIVFAGLLSAGCKVIDLGILPTPTAGIMVRKLRADGAVVITASHNPLPWNGLKFIRGDGIFLNEDQAGKLIRIYQKKDFIKGKPKTLSADLSGIDTHIQKILKAVNPSAVRRKKFKVALDCCNGAGSEACLKLLQALGCRVEAINCDLSLPFPHPPEPLPENLGSLAKYTKIKKADIGFALDADADRLAIVSERGKPIGEEKTLVLAVQFALSKNSKKKIVVTNLSTTRAIDDIVLGQGGSVIRTKIGEVHVAEKLKRLKGLIGGEGNGGVIYPSIGFNRDALTAMALTLSFMADSGKKISELASEIPSYFMIKKKMECRNQAETEALLKKAKNAFRKDDLVLTDGVKAVFPSRWVQVRASNTEPIIRVIAEGKEKREAQNLIKKIFDSLR